MNSCCTISGATKELRKQESLVSARKRILGSSKLPSSAHKQDKSNSNSASYLVQQQWNN